MGGLGVLEDAAQAGGLARRPGLELVLLGESQGWLGQSLWLREIIGQEAGAPPPVDLAAERRTGDFCRAQLLAGHIAACHDVSDGGVLVAVAEMALAGDCGAILLAGPAAIPPHGFWFGEDQGRYILACADAAALLAAAQAAGIAARRLGRSEASGHLTLPDGVAISMQTLRAAHERFFPAWMAR
jgi:phosphoribosylformylglycinamidine synthase